MTARTHPHRSGLRRASLATAAVAAALVSLLGAGCNNSKSAVQRQVEPGTYDQKGNGDFFFVESNFGGNASAVRLSRQLFGRLVSVEAFDGDPSPPAGMPVGERIVVHRDFVIDPRSEADWDLPNYALETNGVTGAQTLVIFRDFSDTADGGGRDQFRQLLVAAANGVRDVADNGFFSGQNTMVPRNAAFVIQFDDLINPASINADSVRVLVGDPAILPFQARVIADPNFGDLAEFDGQEGLEFYPTRLIVDPVVSEADSFTTMPPLPVNTLVLPASINVTRPNVEVRLASQDIGQPQPVLQNPSQSPLTTVSNGTVDFSSGTLDVVRLFRSGGRESVTADPFNGFLPDDTPPVLVGSNGVVVRAIRPTIDPDTFEVDLQFVSATCAQEPARGDLLVKDAIFLEVDEWLASSGGLISGVLADRVLVTIVAVPPGFTGPSDFVPGPGEYRFPYVFTEDMGREACFIRLSPGVPDSNFPTLNVPPSSTFSVAFNEPMDPDQLEPYEAIRLLREPPPADPTVTIRRDLYIPGLVRGSANFQEFTFEPLLSLSHVANQSETYSFDLPGGALSPRDLAGNPIIANLQMRVDYQIDSTAPSEITGGRIVRFEGPDEEAPFADVDSDIPIERLPLPEYGGQINYDLDRGRIRPRPVVRSQVVVGPGSQLPGALAPGPGTTLPLTPFGARTQFVWRYADFGSDLPLYEQDAIRSTVDLNSLNVDVEGVWLSPFGGNPVFESYPEFQMAMAHSFFLPDEVVDPFQNLVVPQSGIAASYSGNLLDQLNDPLQIVHPRELGYTVNPAERELAPDGTVLIPLPMNPDSVPIEQRRYYTWRDTALQARAGPNGFGAPMNRVEQLTAEGPRAPFIDPLTMEPICNMIGAPNPIYFPGDVRTAGLPLLIDLRCYPSGGAVTANLFENRLGHTSTLPGFRAYSAGGRDTAGSLIIVDPDSETTANGGFDTTTTPPGDPLPGVDNVLYLGALDLVVRVSRAHSIFYPAVDPFDSNQDPFPAPTYVEPAIFPEEPPQGSQVDLDYRGAASVASTIALTDASQTDPYGDYYETIPFNYVPPDEDPDTERQGNASCFDGSFNFVSTDQNVGVGFLGDDDTWKDTIAEINGLRFFQVRITFVANAATGETPEIAALGFGWRQ
ncbi:MAG: Ig-like domain-containing protein [Planctomycetota bacterium]